MYIYIFNYHNMLIVPKPLCLALTTSHLSMHIFNCQESPAFYCIELTSKSELIVFTNDPASSTVFSILINGTKIYSFSQAKDVREILNDLSLPAICNQSPNSASITIYTSCIHLFLSTPPFCFYTDFKQFFLGLF